MLLRLGLRTVIDLRSDVEIARQPSAFAGHDGVNYHHIALFEWCLFSASVDAMMLEKDAFDLSSPRRAMSTRRPYRPAIARVAAAIATAEAGMVLFNCTAGKDRTGIVAAMLLSLAGVESEKIAVDYALTASIAGTLMEKLKTHAITRGLDEGVSGRLVSSEPAAMLTFLRHMEDRYGSFQKSIWPMELPRRTSST